MAHKRFADMTPAEAQAVRSARRAKEAEGWEQAKAYAQAHPVAPEERARLKKMLDDGFRKAGL